MESIVFELSNLQRRYLGLDEVQPEWERVMLVSGIYLYFDGVIIRKMVNSTSDGTYQETDHLERTAENRTILLPKTKRGKPRKLNYTATKYFSYRGVYFYFGSSVIIGNYTTQTTFYSDDNERNLTINEWLDKWVNETTEQNLEELRLFKIAKRKHKKYAEGDFFTFKVGRNKWGFGRLVLNIAERRKDSEFKETNLGLCKLMGKALYIAIYRKLSDTPDIDIDELRKCEMLPSQAIMDNRFYYGEFRIIGNRPMEPEEWEPILSYSTAYLFMNKRFKVYIQYGLICRERWRRITDRYLSKNNNYCDCIYRNESIGFNIKHYSRLEQIITEGIDNDSLLWKHDLRKKSNYKAKRRIFRSFGLDADKSYAENLRMLEAKEKQSIVSLLRRLFIKK